MDTAAVGVTQKEDREQGIDQQDIFGWCPSIAWMKRRQRKAGRLLIASVDDSQRSLGKRKDVEPTGSYGTTMPAQSRSTSTFWPGRHRELPATKARLAMVYFGFAAPTSNDAFPVVLQTSLAPWWTTAEEQRAGLCHGPDARQSCICCHPRYRGTPPSFSPMNTTSIISPRPTMTIVRSTMALASMLVVTRTVRVFTATRWKACGPACAIFWTTSRVSANASFTSESPATSSCTTIST